MPIDPADYEDEPEYTFDEPTDNQKHYSGFQAMSGTSMNTPMSGTSMSAPYLMMIIFQIRMLIQQLQSQGIPDHTLRTAIYTLLRVQLNKAVNIRPGTDESWAIAVDDVKNFNDVADCLFAAYAKDRSLCREGLTQVLKGDNFSITLEMSSPNSQENVNGH